MRIVNRAFGLVALLSCLAVAAYADNPAFTIDNTTGFGLANPPFTLGWAFTANSNISVTGIGVFDDLQDGLVDSYDVGIWDSVGNLLGSSTVSAGTVDPLINQFRYVKISPVALTSGQDYTVGALYLTGNDPLIFPGTAINFATDPRVTFNQSRFASGGSLSNPASSVSNDPSYFGPNFLLTSTSVPEPGTWAMLSSLGFSGLLFLRRKRA